MDSPCSRRTFLAGGALSLVSLAGCAGVSAPLPDSNPAPVDRDADRNGNDCADVYETLSVDNEYGEQATIGVTIVHEHDGEKTVFDEVFRVPPGGGRIVREPVFASGLGTYRIGATYEQFQTSKTIEGVPCHTRRNRLVSVTLDQYGSLGVDVEWA